MDFASILGFTATSGTTTSSSASRPFTAGRDGAHYIRLYPNADVAGAYTIQVSEVTD